MTPLRVAAAAILVVAAVLIFWGLSARLLWVDEAETALLGKNVLRYGFPRAFDGKNLISQEAGHDYDHRSYAWIWTPWLEKYVAAGSFALFGASTWSARLPFALLGLACVASMYPLGLLLFRDRAIGVLGMAALASSVPFLLHVRQCRYYSLVILGSLWAVYFLVGVVRGGRRASLGLVAAMSVVFHSNFLSFFGMGAALLTLVWFLAPDRAALRRLALCAGAVALLNGPWLWYFRFFSRSEERVYPVLTNLKNYLELVSRYAFPFVALALFLVLAALLRRRFALLDAPSRPMLAGLLAATGSYLVILSSAPWFFFRYVVNLLPIFAVVSAYLCRRLWVWNRAAGAAFTGLLLFTGVFHTLSVLPLEAVTAQRFREGKSFPAFDLCFPLGNYLHELTHDVKGPVEAILAYLERYAQPGDKVFISYADLVLKFYTQLEVRGGQTGESLKEWTVLPDWIVVRGFFRFGDRPHMIRDKDAMLLWLKKDVPWPLFYEIKLPVSDVPWDDIPEPYLHWYRQPSARERFQLFRRL